jgi:checkpoint serine/threonine-protein kinase
MYTREVERREEVWAFLESRNIGTNHALFYEEWASATEGLGRYVFYWSQKLTSSKKKADEIYQLGINRSAAPVERLKTRHKAFLQRILVASSRDIPDDEPLLPTRSAGRSILGQVATPSAAISGSVQLAPSTRLSRAPNGAKMGIFTDEPGHRGQDDGPGEWGDFGTRDERRKENTVEATPWKGETIPQKGVAPRTPKVEVFRDMVRFFQAARTDIQGDNQEVVRPAEEALFKPKKLTDAELLKKNPLLHYDNQSLPHHVNPLDPKSQYTLPNHGSARPTAS